VARSLARQGISFLVLGPERHSPAFYSRHVRHSLLAPSPASEPQAFVEFALAAIQKHKIKLAIPITDQALLAFERHRQELESHTRLAMASQEALRSVLDKRRNLELAQRLGIPCARQFELRDRKQVPEMIAALGFPIVLKRPGDPTDPSVPAFEFRVLYAHNEEELRGYLDRYCREGAYPLFQEFAAGEVHNLCCFAAEGELLAVHEYHSVRRLEGAGVLRKIVEPVPELVGYTRDLLQALRWDGVAHVGFFVDQARGKTWYMETNGRFWASTEGSIHAGWDFPAWVYDYFVHGKKPRPGPLKIGSLTCWHCGDMLALINYLRGGEVPATGTEPGKLGATLQYLSGFHPAIHSDVFRWSDPMPGVMDYWQRRRQLTGFLGKRLRLG